MPPSYAFTHSMPMAYLVAPAAPTYTTTMPLMQAPQLPIAPPEPPVSVFSSTIQVQPLSLITGMQIPTGTPLAYTIQLPATQFATTPNYLGESSSIQMPLSTTIQVPKNPSLSSPFYSAPPIQMPITQSVTIQVPMGAMSWPVLRNSLKICPWFFISTLLASPS